LYFVAIPGTCLPNPGNCLWKAPNGLAWRGLQGFILPHFQCSAPFAVSGRPKLKPSPPQLPEQGAKTVHFALPPVRIVEIAVDFQMRDQPHPVQDSNFDLAGSIC